VDALIKSSGALPAAKPIADNEEILKKLSDLISDIDSAPDPKLETKRDKGQLYCWRWARLQRNIMRTATKSC